MSGERIADDPQIADTDTLYRSIPANHPDFIAFHSVTGVPIPHAQSLRREPGTGLSAHLDSVLQARGRTPETLYEAGCPSFCFSTGIPRKFGDGVALVAPVGECDPDRAASHVEIWAAADNDTREHWRAIRDQIIRAFHWVVTPEQAGVVLE